MRLLQMITERPLMWAQVRNDPWGARKYFEQADKLEDEAAEMGDGDGDDDGAMAARQPSSPRHQRLGPTMLMFCSSSARRNPQRDWRCGNRSTTRLMRLPS